MELAVLHYQTKHNNIVYGLKTQIVFRKPLAHIFLKCTLLTFEVAKYIIAYIQINKSKYKSKQKNHIRATNIVYIIKYRLSNYP